MGTLLEFMELSSSDDLILLCARNDKRKRRQNQELQCKALQTNVNPPKRRKRKKGK